PSLASQTAAPAASVPPPERGRAPAGNSFCQPGPAGTSPRSRARRSGAETVGGAGSPEVLPARPRGAPSVQGESAAGPAGPRLHPPRAGRGCTAEAEPPGKSHEAGGRRRRQVSRGPPHPHRRRQEEEGTAAGPRGRGCPAREARDLVRPKVDLTGCQLHSPPPPPSGSPSPRGAAHGPRSPTLPPIGSLAAWRPAPSLSSLPCSPPLPFP
ncbi:PREDICTED: nascent polypeptide-associated complex subunit alpha, muscle-specific form-like, partial [Cercocebus atys]|uniref:nascent polypeptide-associated complex subunit alpha, muscle-specific form-like n=1 Tax=Cercocebus atys TaxID=9531 RepID=UPI0005F4EA55